VRRCADTGVVAPRGGGVKGGYGSAGIDAESAVRRCQRLGFKGFHELKLALAREGDLVAQSVVSDGAEEDPPGAISRKTSAAQARAIGESSAALDEGAFGRAVVCHRRGAGPIRP